MSKDGLSSGLVQWVKPDEDKIVKRKKCFFFCFFFYMLGLILCKERKYYSFYVPLPTGASKRHSQISYWQKFLNCILFSTLAIPMDTGPNYKLRLSSFMSSFQRWTGILLELLRFSNRLMVNSCFDP